MHGVLNGWRAANAAWRASWPLDAPSVNRRAVRHRGREHLWLLGVSLTTADAVGIDLNPDRPTSACTSRLTRPGSNRRPGRRRRRDTVLYILRVNGATSSRARHRGNGVGMRLGKSNVR